MSNQKPVFSIQYLGNICYYYLIQQYAEISVETTEHYIKQTFRNRTVILTANGLMPLIIPVIHKSSKEPIYQKEICYKEKWYKKHFNAILSAYKNASYFDFYADELLQFLQQTDEKYLFQFNLNYLNKIFSVLGIKTKVLLTETYEKHYNKDFRNYFDNPFHLPECLKKPYIQVFNDRFSFQKNLSILDLIFNLGPDAKEYISGKFKL